MNIIRVEQRKKMSDGTTRTYQTWRGTWTDANGVRHQTSLGNCEVVGEQEAKRLLVTKMQEGARRNPASITVREWCDDVLAIVGSKLDQTSLNSYRLVADRLCDSWGEGRRLSSVQTEDANRFIATVRSLGVGAHTIRRHFTLAKSIMARATKAPSRANPYVKHNPFDDAEVPDQGEASDFAYVSPEACVRFIQQCTNTHWRALFALTRLCALRAEEALSCEPGHFVWDDPRVGSYLKVVLRDDRKGKGAGTKQKQREVGLSPAAETILLNHFNSLAPGAPRMIDRSALGLKMSQHVAEGMRVWLDRAGILGVVKPFHDLRKSQADDWSALYGERRSAVWCGHSIEVAIKHYRRHNPEDLALVTKRANPTLALADAYAELDRAVRLEYHEGTKAPQDSLHPHI